MKRLPILTIGLILLICIVFVKHDRWSRNSSAWTSVINSDGYGYVAYLPTLFLYHNLDFKKSLHAVTKIRPDVTDDDVSVTILNIGDNRQLDKCFVGIAVLLLPFFLLTCLIAQILGFNVDGFSCPFQLGVSIAGLFYLFIGLLYLYKLMKLYHIKDFIICFILFTVVFATNLYYYVVMEPSMPHVYDFSLVTVFLYFIKKSINNFRLNYIIWATISLGVLIIIRPTNFLVVLTVPFLAGGLKQTNEFLVLFFKSRAFIIVTIIIFTIIGIQLGMWYIQTGHFYIWSYPGEGFNFRDPHITDILFSYRKGWFVYTPIMFFILLVSLVWFYINDKFRFLSLLVFFIVITYIFSSWWYWAYGGSFGSRPFIDYYSFFALAIGVCIDNIDSKLFKSWAFIVFISCLVLNIIQVKQYEGLIIPTDGMTKSVYWKIFLKTDTKYMKWWEAKDIEKDYDFITNKSFRNNFETNTEFDSKNITNAYAHSGYRSLISSSTLPYSTIFKDTVPILFKYQQSKLSLYTSFWVYIPDHNNDSKLVVSLGETGKPEYFSHSKGLSDMVDSCNKWVEIQDVVDLPKLKNKSDILKVMVCTTSGIVYIDDVEVKFGVHK